MAGWVARGSVRGPRRATDTDPSTESAGPNTESARPQQRGPGPDTDRGENPTQRAIAIAETGPRHRERQARTQRLLAGPDKKSAGSAGQTPARQRGAVPDAESAGPRHRERWALTGARHRDHRGQTQRAPGPDTEECRGPTQRAPGTDTETAGPDAQSVKRGPLGPDTDPDRERRAPT